MTWPHRSTVSSSTRYSTAASGRASASPDQELARRLDISRNTVALAYDRLVADGFLVGRAGAGTFVSGEPVRGGPRRRASSARARSGRTLSRRRG
ncbi:GntR family transcriptional regulator [Nonomuraea thailandensis]